MGALSALRQGVYDIRGGGSGPVLCHRGRASGSAIAASYYDTARKEITAHGLTSWAGVQNTLGKDAAVLRQVTF